MRQADPICMSCGLADAEMCQVHGEYVDEEFPY
jgi:hypothetical protein